MLTTGNKIIGAASGVVMICFFLPWILVSCEGQPVASLSGWQLAVGTNVQNTLQSPPIFRSPPSPPIQGSPVLFLVLLAAIGCLAIIYLIYRRQLALQIGSFGAIGLAVLSLLILLFKMVDAQPDLQQTDFVNIETHYQSGLFGTILGYLGIIVGAVLNLTEKDLPARAEIPEPEDSTIDRDFPR